MTSDRSYPIPRPESGDDRRFCLGLALDISKVLADYNYPPITTGTDLIYWQQRLFTTIYQEKQP